MLRNREHWMAIAVVAARTGSGKSQTTRYVSRILKALGKRVVVARRFIDLLIASALERPTDGGRLDALVARLRQLS